MQLFFNQSQRLQKVLIKDPSWAYASSGLRRNIQLLQDYYRNAGYATRGNHLLVRILNSLGVQIETPLERFYEIVNAKTHRYSLHFKLTSPVYSGQLHDGVFYGTHTKEILIADDTTDSPYRIQKQWRTYPSIKVLDHPRSDLDCLLPNGKANSVETGTATIAINISAMAVQFREYLLQQAQRIDLNENPQTVPMFVHKVLLPNMLESHLDTALLNRFINLAIGKPMGSSLQKHPIYTVDMSKHVDGVYRNLLKTFQSQDVEYETYLRSIPLVYQTHAQDLLKLPELAPTRQLTWAEYVTRLKTIEFLFRISPSSGSKMSAQDQNYLLKKIVQYSSDGIFRQISDSETYLQTIRTTKEIVSMAERKLIPIA